MAKTVYAVVLKEGKTGETPEERLNAALNGLSLLALGIRLTDDTIEEAAATRNPEQETLLVKVTFEALTPEETELAATEAQGNA